MVQSVSPFDVLYKINELAIYHAAGKDMSKTSGTIAIFHEMKCAVVARLFEGRSPEFRSHRHMSP